MLASASPAYQQLLAQREELNARKAQLDRRREARERRESEFGVIRARSLRRAQRILQRQQAAAERRFGAICEITRRLEQRNHVAARSMGLTELQRAKARRRWSPSAPPPLPPHSGCPPTRSNAWSPGFTPCYPRGSSTWSGGLSTS